MNPIIRLPHAKSLLLASASALALTIAAPGAAYAFGPLSEHVMSGGATGPAPNPTSPIPGLPTAVSTQAQAQAAQAQTTANLATAAARLQAALTAQANARAAAQAGPNNLGADPTHPGAPLPNVPDGLAAGGLNPDSGLAANGTANPVITWVGANTPTQTAANGQTTVTVNQTQQAAILNWQTFNVGKKTTVNFVQKDSTGDDQTSWVALNKVNDPAALPSQILGQINAPGSVYVVNRNGVIFGGSSQINVHSLVAAAVDFDNNQFLNNGIYSPTTADSQGNLNYSPSFTNAGGNIAVQAGAQINTAAPASVTAGGGSVMLLGQNVENDGAITTPIGQTILAAGDNFLIRPGYSTSGSNPYSTTNGAEISPVVEANGNWIPGGTGTVTNIGAITAQQGDITLVGHTINQDGVLFSTTSVATRGTIHLLNSISDATGVITIGSGTLTDVMPEVDSTDTALNAQRSGLGASPTINPSLIGASAQFDDLSNPLGDKRYQSRIDVVTGGSVEFQGTSLTLANAGQINVAAQKRLQIDDGALLDVSGVNVTLPASADVLTVNIQGNEERDDPNNRDDGSLFNDNVYVDPRQLILVPAGTGGYTTDRYYTPGGLLEVSGELANVGHTEGEWASSGGAITLSTDAAAGAVIAQTGANFNLEGGSIAYQAGRVPTTWLRASDGSIVNINQATADKIYVGLANSFQVDHSRWVVTDNFSGGLLAGSTVFQPGYVVGRDAGSLLIASPTVLFNSTVSAGVVAGTQQNSARPATVTDPFLESQATIPLAGSLFFQPLPFFGDDGSLARGSASLVEIGKGTTEGDSLTFASAIPVDAVNTIKLNADLLDSFGLGGLGIEASMPVAVNAPLTLAPGGQLSLSGQTVSVNANITAHSGSVSIFSDGSIMPPHVVGLVSIGPDVTIDTTGLWTDVLQDPMHLGGLAFLDGGSVSLSSSGDVILGQGSLIDASSGAAILAGGKQAGGAGGDISLLADYVPNSFTTAIGYGYNQGGVTLGGMLRSYGVTKGGSLTIQGGTVIIGDDSTIAGGILAAGMAAPANLVLGIAVLPSGQTLMSAVTPTLPYTIKAGTPMPFDYTYQQPVFTAAGTTLASSTLMPGNNYSLNPNGRCIGCAVTQAPWTIPSGGSNGFEVYDDNNGGTPIFTSYAVGQTVPAGSVIVGGGGVLPAGYVIPADVFPHGLQTSSTPIPLSAGQTYTADITVPGGLALPSGYVLVNPVTLSGAQIQKGTVLPSQVALQPVMNLAPSFFQQGFSNYSIIGVSGLTVTDGTTVDVEMPVLRFTAASSVALTGTSAQDALQLWQPPLDLIDPTHATITQRGGASLILSTAPLTALATFSGDLSIGKGVVMNVDPGQSITLSGHQEIDVEGSLNAPGGNISVVNPAILQTLSTTTRYIDDVTDPDLSIWIGDRATLNVAAQAVTALDQQGRTFGSVPDGGSITLGSDYGVRDSQGVLGSSQSAVVVRPGAVLDASGTAATLDLSAGLSSLKGSAPQLVASNGGSINLSSYNGLYIDGTMEAFAGGAGASGGTLSLVLETPIYARLPATNATRQLRILSVDSQYAPTGIADDPVPGGDDPAMIVGTAHIAQQQIQAGGFDNLLLHGGDSTVFNGNVNIVLGQSLTIEDGRISLSPATPNANVQLSAPYVLLTGDIGEDPNPDTAAAYYQKSATQTTQQGTLSINADLIDAQDPVAFGLRADITEATGPDTIVDLPAFGSVNLTSQGDIRLLAANNPTQANSSEGLQFTSIINIGAINLTAERIYPETGSTATIVSGQAITVGRIGSGDVEPPDSVFGALTLLAPEIDQGGVIEAPLGRLTFGGYVGGTAGGSLLIGGGGDVSFLPGSITSVSAAGLTTPFGGTADGLTYYYDGNQVSFPTAYSGGYSSITTDAASVNVEQGALLDLSGGGTLTGAGFISGRGGSIDILRSPLIAANPSSSFSGKSDEVYAIVPGYVGSYAPFAPDNGWGSPVVGQQVTIGSGVPGLAAGTYTLLPSTYATLPGAYRVEIGGTASNKEVPGKLADGSYLADGTLSVAGTAIHDTLPAELLITSGTTLRAYSQYSETGYSAFAEAQAAQFGNDLPALPNDAKWLNLEFSGGSSAPLTIDGIIDLQPTSDAGDSGRASTVSLYVPPVFSGAPNTTPIEVRTASEAPTAGTISLVDTDLDALGAGSLIIGGLQLGGQLGGQANQNVINIETPSQLSGGGVTIRSGVTLSAAAIWIPGSPTQPVTIESGATLSTVGKGPATWDSITDNYLLQFGGVGLANANVWLVPVAASGSIASGANLFSDGAVVAAGGSGFAIGASPNIGAKDLIIGGSTINIGSVDGLAQASAAGVLPQGWSLNQTVLDALLNPASGVGLENLTLIGSNAINVVGSVDLNTLDPVTGKSRVSLLLETPAIYGLGNGSATLTTDNFVWTDALAVTPSTAGDASVSLAIPGGVSSSGPGTGSERLTINANTILLGFPSNSLFVAASTDRLALGFSNVTLNASQSISANNTGTLSVYQTGPDPSSGFDPSNYAGSGGSLSLNTPLLTTDNGARIGFLTTGQLDIEAPGAGIANTGNVNTRGGEIDLKAGSVKLNTAVALPTGNLSVVAQNDIALGANADIDLSGRKTSVFDYDSYSWGGTASFESTSGNIHQDAASLIDVSAVHNSAGSVSFTATDASAGLVDLAGQIKGDATESNLAGSVDIRANSLTDFVGLNTRLDRGGIFGARSFSIDTGDLVLNDLKAQTINISVNGGSLTVNGTLDASGSAPGTIRLSAKDDLTLGSSSVLDAHGTVLQTDSYGQPIDAENRGHVELTATSGTMTLSPGATIDVSVTSPQGTLLAADGDIELNVPRGTPGATVSPSDETSGDVKIIASSPLTIKGAQTVAVNAFWTYVPTDADGSIIQDNLDSGSNPVALDGPDIGFVGLNQINARNTTFINAAIGNNDLLGRLSGLRAYTDAFHLRPGVEIDSATPTGDLNTVGDLDFSGFRYASLNPNSQETGIYGSGEVGDIVLRAGGDLNINGNVSDGFAPGPEMPIILEGRLKTTIAAFDGLETIDTGAPITSDITFTQLPTPNAASGTSLFYGSSSGGTNYPPAVLLPGYYYGGGAYHGGTTVVSGEVIDHVTGHVFTAGMTIGYFAVGGLGTTITAGTKFSSTNAGVADGTALFTGTGESIVASSVHQVSPKTPLGTTVRTVSTPGGAETITTTVADSSAVATTSIPALGAMLAPGSQSWSMRLVSGADLFAADTRTVRPKSTLNGTGNTELTDAFQTSTQECLVCVGSVESDGISVVRTGTGSLDIVAGGNVAQNSLFGIYTAGTQSAGVAPQFELPRGNQSDGTLLGSINAAFVAADSDYLAYYPTGGGDVLISAQGDITGYQEQNLNVGNAEGVVPSDGIGNWLWRQGGEGQSGAWWINFGTYGVLKNINGDDILNVEGIDPRVGPLTAMLGFTGMGTLGGGNLTVLAGGDAGVISGNDNKQTSALDLFIGSTGRVNGDGSITQTGGGLLNLRIGGALNPATDVNSNVVGSETWGVIGNIRGDINIEAGAIGTVVPVIAPSPLDDPRPESPFVPSKVDSLGGPIFAPGDGTVTINTLRDINIGTVVDPGRVPLQNAVAVDATTSSYSSFTLWQTGTAVNLASAGANIVPENVYSDGERTERGGDGVATELLNTFVYPPIFSADAMSGNIYYGYYAPSSEGVANPVIELAPSPVSQLTMIAANSIDGDALQSTNGLSLTWTLSGAALSSEATPQNPGYVSGNGSNVWGRIISERSVTNGYLSLLNFGPDTPTSGSRSPDAPATRFYAGDGDLFDLRYGYMTQANVGFTTITDYIGGAPLDARASDDIVNFGQPFNLPLFTDGYYPQNGGAGGISSFILNYNPSDVSVISAGRDIVYANTVVAGPGDLEVTAGRNIYQGDHGLIESIGPVFGTPTSDRSGGADVTVLAGIGAGGPDLTDFANLYLNNANQADPDFPLDFPQNQGKVAKSYEDDLYAWLQQRFGYAGSEGGTLAYFLSLPSDQQLVFAAKVYFEELDASDVEFNDPSSRRFQSYVRGKQAIAELFPSQDASGNAIDYSGSLTLASGIESIYRDPQPETLLWDSGIHTEFGGDINILTPGGGATLGAEGIVPGASSGLLTEGSGNINIYAEDSIPLGLSRVFTTFGGDITMWSATGDINAGRGAKGTVVFTPVRRTYDLYGNAALAPTVPSQGAGIATLAPIPGVPPGNVYLVAPEGIIDAGEAGIRVSGNAFLAALQVVNAANIQVKGQAFGLPPKPVTNLSFTAASTAATEAASIVRKMASTPELTISVEVTGFGGQSAEPEDCIPSATNACK